ncbi:hypothetical protein [Sphingobacterium spiritivorum]|uniref:hypothetical protein n=1 Tax=Sphingobacterium spiritivorum TaxID=258 RepID=UPI003DA45B24
MKTIEITTGKATIVVVDMPEECFVSQISIGGGLIETAIGFPDGSYRGINKFNQNLKELGPLSQVTEDQWKEIVDQSLHTGLHPHYVNGINPPNAYCYQNATESGLSLLRANGVVLENALGTWNGSDRRPQTFPDGAQFNSAIELYNFQKKWDKHQSEVWKNPYIFIKVK